MDKYEKHVYDAIEALYVEHPSYDAHTLVTWANQFADEYKQKSFKAYNSPLVEQANKMKRSREKMMDDVSVAEKKFNYRETKDASTRAGYDI